MNKIFCYNTIVSVQCTNVLLNFHFSLTSIFPVSELSFFHLWNSKIYNIGQYLWGCWLTKTKWEIIRLFPTYRRQRKLQHIRYVYRVIRIRTVFKPHIRYSDSCERGLNCLWRAVSKHSCFDVRSHWVGRDGGPMHMRFCVDVASTNYRKVRLEFLSSWLANRQWLFLKGQSCCVLKSGYTGGAQNKDFGAVSQTDLTRV